MKELKSTVGRIIALCGVVWAGFVFTGCQSEPQYADIPLHPNGAAKQGGGQYAYQPPKSGKTDFFQIGDTVKVTYTTPESTPPLPPATETIKDDGTISLNMIGPVVAAGKSPGQLQTELQEMYKKYFVNMTVTVSTENRFYYVHGEVKADGPKPYLGDTDIVKAISSGGGFTEFANKKKIRLTRGNKTQIIDFNKAIEDRQYNVPVYPGDTLVVPRRIF
jgi:protein involved in polysaccharide export with SLBB domain